MKLSEKIRYPSTLIGGPLRSMRVGWFTDRADEVAILEARLQQAEADRDELAELLADIQQRGEEIIRLVLEKGESRPRSAEQKE